MQRFHTELPVLLLVNVKTHNYYLAYRSCEQKFIFILYFCTQEVKCFRLLCNTIDACRFCYGFLHFLQKNCIFLLTVLLVVSFIFACNNYLQNYLATIFIFCVCVIKRVGIIFVICLCNQ